MDPPSFHFGVFFFILHERNLLMCVFWWLLLMSPALKSVRLSHLISSHCLPPTPSKFVKMGQSRNPRESSLVICGLRRMNCVCPKLMGLWGKGGEIMVLLVFSQNVLQVVTDFLQGRWDGGYFWPENLLAGIKSVELKLPGFESFLWSGHHCNTFELWLLFAFHWKLFDFKGVENDTETRSFFTR